MRRNPNIGILNSPAYSQNEIIFLDKHIQTLRTICNEIFVVTGNYPTRYSENVHIIEIERGRTRARKPSLFLRVADYLMTQIKLTFYLARLSKSLDIIFFDIGEYRNILPVLLAKVLRKRTMVVHSSGNKSLESRIENSSGLARIVPPLQDTLLKICYLLIDHILCISPSIVKFGGLEKYKHKIMFWGGDYIDTDSFQIKSLPHARGDIVGYAGRLSRKKGVVNLVKAVPLVARERPNVEFFIAGSGEEKDVVVAEAGNVERGRITLFPWIPDEDFPNYLNQLKLFVLPSFEEGVPAVLKEAMACGVVVLATPVGGIPDLIKDGETGFILRKNTPSCIGKAILEVLNSPRLDEIAIASRTMVETENSYDASVEKWKSLLAEILLDKKREPSAR